MALLTTEYLGTKTYAAVRDRVALQHGGSIQPGVWDPTDYQVIQRGAGANMSVDVRLGSAIVAGTTTGNKGYYHQENDATVNVPIAAAHATLPRIDQIILTVNDSQFGGASDTPTLTSLAGTATSGATLTNRTNAATLPANSIRLADVLVGPAVTSITTTNIQDRRQWARGANYVTGGFIQFHTTTTYPAFGSVAMDVGTSPAFNVELSGGAFEVFLHGLAWTLSGAGSSMWGIQAIGPNNTTFQIGGTPGLGTQTTPYWVDLSIIMPGGHTPGRYEFHPVGAGDGIRQQNMGTGGTNDRVSFGIREHVRQSAAN